MPPVARVIAPPAMMARPATRQIELALSRFTEDALPGSTGFRLDPHVDYGRFLTPEGGMLFCYKDIDQRWRHLVWRVFAWTASSGAEGWFLLHHSPVQSTWITVLAWLALAIFNWLIVAKPVEIYRRVEVRPDCMIIDGAEVFWQRLMEGGMPSFQPDEKGNMLFCGIYGTRFVEYFTARRFDELDRTPEVFANGLQKAMTQLWEPARTHGQGRFSSPQTQAR